MKPKRKYVNKKVAQKNEPFTNQLMNWHYTLNKRQMPWKGEKDPYKIWLSEIILQQTRVEQGWHYYLKFIEVFPTVEKLAAASDETVFKMWEGLGYYNRCRNLLHTARVITDQFKGKFPNDYEALLKLKGVGGYTASAIASFAFGLPYAVVDGNVIRVLARYFGLDVVADSPSGIKIFSNQVNMVLDKSDPAGFNQAIMDFGATICKPLSPLCIGCPLLDTCVAHQKGLVNSLPVKNKKPEKKQRYFCYFIFRKGKKVWISQRNERDIWQNLHEFWLFEVATKIDFQQFVPENILNDVQVSFDTAVEVGGIYKQALTHQQIFSRFFLIDLKTIPPGFKDGKWVNRSEMEKAAFPKTITLFLSENSVV
jgi:A/G-specific adenine glycosylase